MRRIIFYLFVLAYLALCPLIILDSLGIRIRPNESKVMMSTGLISVETIPEGAAIFVNGRPYGKPSPAIIRDLSAGTYDIKITHPGYLPWEKVVPVEKAQATLLQSVLLIPNTWQKQVLSSEPFSGLLPAEDAPFFLLYKSTHLQTLSVFKWDTGLFNRLGPPQDFTPDDWSLSEIFATRPFRKPAKLTGFFRVPESAFILAQAEHNGDISTLRINTDRTGAPAENISAYFSDRPEEVRWDADDPTDIFYRSGQTLGHLDLETGRTVTGLAGGLKGFTVFNHKIYWIDSLDRFLQSDYAFKNTQLLTGKMAQMPEAFREATAWRIFAFSDDNFIFLNEKGRLFSNRLPYRLVNDNVTGFNKTLNKKRLLIWTKRKLGLIDFSRTSQEGVFETGPEVKWLVADGRDIRQAFWVNKGTHVLFRDRDRVRIVDVSDGESPAVTVVESDGPVAYADELGKLFYLDKKTHDLTALTVLPPHEYVSFNLPQTFRRKELP